ncbi:hypothetical protein FACS189427_09580 [Planctomycetales bacterium]|nr:hypothetical protein FACS189427_09580 [Planctomycetales bacterium]
MWETAELFENLYQVKVVLLPILPETAVSKNESETASKTIQKEQKKSAALENTAAESKTGSKQRKPTPAPWRSRPQIQQTFSPDTLLLDTRLTGLISSFAENKQYGDLYVSESPEQTEELHRYSLIGQEYPFCYLTLQLLVQKGNPSNIQSVQDILQNKLKVGIVTPSRFGMGTAAWNVLSKVSRKTAQSEASVKETLYNQVQIYNNRQDLIAALGKGEVNAVFVWDVLVYDAISSADVVSLQDDESKCVQQQLMISLRTANEQGYGRRFADFLISPQGQYILKKHGFVPKPL